MANGAEQREIIRGWDTSLDPTTAPTRVFMSAKDYWSKLTPEERSKEMKRRAAMRKGNGSKAKESNGSKPKRKVNKRKSIRTKTGVNNGRVSAKAQEDHQHHISYIFGKVETIIEYYANSNGLSKQALAEGVAELLRH